MKKSLFLLGLVFMCLASFAQSSEIFVKDGQAIRGYDPVAFFESGKPVKGDPHFTTKWKGADWYFSSQKNLDAFKSAPEKYSPQFGGYCAYGMAKGHKAPTEPDTWTIVDGKLYFNYNADVKKMWSQMQKDYIMKANENWPNVKDKE